MNKKSYQRILAIFLVLDLCAVLAVGFYEMKQSVPDQIKILAGKQSEFDFNIPAKATLYQSGSSKNKETINLKEPFSISSKQVGSYHMKVSFLGIVPIKEVMVDVIPRQKVIPCGIPIGIYIKTKGVLVLGTGAIEAKDGFTYEPARNVVKAGDYITKVNGSVIENKNDLIELIEENGKNPLVLTLKRKEETLNIKLTPILGKEDGTYRLGIWVRDDSQGIGTLTYATKEKFGALGHGINDIDTGTLMKVEDGKIYPAKIATIIKGQKGIPGEMIGMIQYEEEEKLGDIKKNTQYGIYGKCDENLFTHICNEEIEIGMKQEVKEGKAYIRSYVTGEMKDYEVEIISVDKSNKRHTKGMIIKIVDEDLLKGTNGIIQGMSGSPIIQEGKLIGAVTHVFVNNPRKGYGIFIENMLGQNEIP